MAGNKYLHKAMKVKNDEYFTRLTDIESELRHYSNEFKDTHIFCNCDDPESSNFWRFFALNFRHLGLKQLTSTHYDEKESTYRMDMYRDVPEDAKNKEPFMTLEEKGIDLPLGYITPLEGNGDFRSNESIEILNDCDIIITNPPFSLFREYVEQLMLYEKKFLIIGNKNAVTYKEIFPLLKENKFWIGYRNMNSDMWFEVPEGVKHEKILDGKKVKHIMACWYTNLDVSKRHEDLILYKQYNADEYQTYDNYAAININKVVDIPVDYDGLMGVPITFLDKYNPNQFEILGISKTWATDFEVTSIKKYTNAIQHNQDGTTTSGNKINDGAVLTFDSIPSKGVYYTADESNKYLQQVYARVLIRIKEQRENEN